MLYKLSKDTLIILTAAAAAASTGMTIPLLEKKKTSLSSWRRGQ